MLWLVFSIAVSIANVDREIDYSSVYTPLDSLTLGDRLELTIPAQNPALTGQTAVKVILGDANLKDSFYLEEVAPLLKDAFVIRIAPLKAGSITVPSLLLQSPGGESLGKTKPITIQVKALEAGTEKPPERIGLRLSAFPYVYVLGYSAIAILVSLAMVWLYRRRRPIQIEAPLPTEPERTKLQIAWDRVDSILGSAHDHLSEKNLPRTAHELSYILRVIYEEQYKTTLQELTTREWLTKLERLSIDRSEREKLRGLLRSLDYVRFSENPDLTKVGQESAEALDAWAKEIRDREVKG